MSLVRWKARTNEVAFTTATKTLLSVIAASNHAVKIEEWGISFQGTSNTAAPIRVDVLFQSNDGTGGTGASSIIKDPSDAAETLQTTRKDTYTAEPATPGSILFSLLVHPQTGYTWLASFGKELKVPGGQMLSIRVVTPGAANSATAWINGEE